MSELTSVSEQFTVLGPPKTSPHNVTGPMQIASIPLKCACTALFTATRLDGKARWFAKGPYIRVACPECGAVDKLSRAKLRAMVAA